MYPLCILYVSSMYPVRILCVSCTYTPVRILYVFCIVYPVQCTYPVCILYVSSMYPNVKRSERTDGLIWRYIQYLPYHQFTIVVILWVFWLVHREKLSSRLLALAVLFTDEDRTLSLCYRHKDTQRRPPVYWYTDLSGRFTRKIR